MVKLLISLVLFTGTLHFVTPSGGDWALPGMALILSSLLARNQHLGLILIALELFTLYFLVLSFHSPDFNLGLVFTLVVLSVVEASLGLSLLVCLSRVRSEELCISLL